MGCNLILPTFCFVDQGFRTSFGTPWTVDIDNIHLKIRCATSLINVILYTKVLNVQASVFLEGYWLEVHNDFFCRTSNISFEMYKSLISLKCSIINIFRIRHQLDYIQNVSLYFGYSVSFEMDRSHRFL